MGLQAIAVDEEAIALTGELAAAAGGVAAAGGADVVAEPPVAIPRIAATGALEIDLKTTRREPPGF